jgi:hypothetical protein
MDQLYTTVDASGTKVQCFGVNDYISAWVYTDKYGVVSLTLGYHGTRHFASRAVMEKARTGGVSWSGDLSELLKVTERDGSLDVLCKESLRTFQSSPLIDCGKDKSIQVLFVPGHGRKVQILDNKSSVRMHLPVFQRMMYTLHSVISV